MKSVSDYGRFGCLNNKINTNMKSVKKNVSSFSQYRAEIQWFTFVWQYSAVL